MLIVYTKIVGDLFHVGHVRFLKKAREFGNKLIVHVVDDIRVSKYKRVPIYNQAERAEIIGSCKYVDTVILDGPKVITPQFMKENNFDFYAFGFVNENEKVAKLKDCKSLPDDMLKIVPYTSGISTTSLINKIRNLDGIDTKHIL